MCVPYWTFVMFQNSDFRKMNIEDMYSNLPRSLKQECLVVAKVEDDEEVIKERKKIVETMKPSELSQLRSLSDFPVPSALENIFKTSDKPKAPPRKEKDAEKRE